MSRVVSNSKNRALIVLNGLSLANRVIVTLITFVIGMVIALLAWVLFLPLKLGQSVLQRGIIPQSEDGYLQNRLGYYL